MQTEQVVSPRGSSTAIGEGVASPSFSHRPWTAVLTRFVDADGRVDYESLSRDREDLDRYLKALSRHAPDTHPELFPEPRDALAYFLNAYNAYVFKGVLDRWPDIESVWGNPIAAFNFFVLKKIDLGGEKHHLKGLEDKKVRAGFRDPRVHAVLNCASISCPRLRRRAVEPATLEDDLDLAMAEMVSSPKHFELDARRSTVRISKIFDWFKGDFLDFERRSGQRKPSLIDYVNRFRGSAGFGGDPVPRGYKVAFFPFDKGLNRAS